MRGIMKLMRWYVIVNYVNCTILCDRWIRQVGTILKSFLLKNFTIKNSFNGAIVSNWSLSFFIHTF